MPRIARWLGTFL